MIKRIFLVALCLVMVVGCLAACNKTEPEVTEPTVNENPTEAPTDEVTEPVEDTEPSEDETEPPVEDTQPAVTVDQKLMDVMTQAQEKLGEEFRPNMEIPAEMMTDMFGLLDGTYESAYGFMPMISAHVDTLVGVKAIDVEAVKSALETYVEGKKNDRMQYPINAAAMGAMEVVVVGDYVWLVGTFGATDTVAESGDEAILKYAQDNVAKVVEIINTVCAG